MSIKHSLILATLKHAKWRPYAELNCSSADENRMS